MKTNTPASVLLSSILFVLAMAMSRPAAVAQTGTGTHIDLTLNETLQSAFITWFGDQGVLYQLESSTNLSTWADASPVFTGSDNYIIVTRPITGQSRLYFRLKDIPDVITAVFNPITGVLTVTGGDLDSNIGITRNAAGAILVNGGFVTITGGVPTVVNTTLIQVFGRGGNDTLSLDETNGALPRAEMSGEAGHDTLRGGSGADVLSGGPGRDVLLGMGGADTMFGGDDNDTLTGGDADDQVFGEGGTDRFIWNPGDDTDLNEGGPGTDTVQVNGGNGDEQFTATANSTRVRFDRLNPAPFSLDIGTCEQLVLSANGGNDSFSATGNLAALIQITVDGGTGDDTLLGSNGIDHFFGGDNNDFIDGQQGNDVIYMGAGDDTFQWDPGDGSDTVEGQAGADTLLFNGSSANEVFDATSNGTRVRFTRNIGSIIMDLDEFETLDLKALGGTDVVNVNDLTGTDLTRLNVNLAGTIGGTTGDAAADIVTVNATGGADLLTVTGAGTSVTVTGLSATVVISTAEGANDRLTVNALGGNDTVLASGLPAGVIALTLSGGTGDDTLTGSAGADQLLGDDDHDSIDGNQGADLVILGGGNDTLQWDPGDGNDIIEGQAGADTLLFNGSNATENLTLSANGARLLFFRDIASVTLDCDDMEKVDLNVLGGTDSVVVGDLAGTDVSEVIVDLAATGGSGDTQADSVTVNGSNGDDTVAIGSTAGTVSVTGLTTAVAITGGEAANDSLTLSAQGGIDVVNASGLPAGVIRLTMNGGLGNDVLIGSQGADSFTGGDGNDTVFGGNGDDVFTWNPGDDNDVIEGQAGTDRLVFNGANVAETFTLSANGGRATFTRNVAVVIMDLNDVETFDLQALGGADILTVNDLTATDLTRVNVNLASTLGGSLGDAAVDLITLNGTPAGDGFSITANAGAVEVSGLAALVRITTPEVANDDLVINGLGGTDIFFTGAGVTSLIGLTTNQ
jgi:Ca2+-binding RTX toxin-like protein